MKAIGAFIIGFLFLTIAITLPLRALSPAEHPDSRLANADWEEVGSGSASGGGISNSGGEASAPTIAVGSGGQVYVAWMRCDLCNDPLPETHVYIRRYTGSQWTTVGAGSDSGAGIDSFTFGERALVAAAPDGTIVLAYVIFDADSTWGWLNVKRWDGSEWSAIGPEDFYEQPGLGVVSLAVGPDSQPYLAFNLGSVVYVLRWNGADWVGLGESATGGGLGLIDGEPRTYGPKIAVATNGDVYVAWSRQSKVVVRRWNGSTWDYVGSAAGIGVDTRAVSLALAPDNTPYVAFRDDRGVYVRRWQSGQWQELGRNVAGNSFTGRLPSIVIDTEGTPFLAWESNPNDGTAHNVYVRRWTGLNWEEVGSGSATGGGVSESGVARGPLLAFGPDGHPYVAWQNGFPNGDIYVRRYPADPTPDCYSLATNVDPQGQGTVQANPPPNCGDKYASATVVSLKAEAAPGSGYTFQSWSGALTGNANPRNVTMDTDKSVTAHFVPAQYTLARTVNGIGSLSVEPDKPFYSANEVVTLQATAGDGYRFSGWSGDLSSSQNPANLTMNGNKSVTANFSPIPCYSLALDDEPSGILTGWSVTPANCAGGKYREGTVISLGVQPAYRFSHWSGSLTGSQNPANLTMNGNKSVTAHFEPVCFSLVTAVDPVGGGAVDVLTAANCAGGKYTAGTQVNLSARRNGDYFFTRWTGDAEGSNANVWLVMDGNKSVVAHFSRPTCYSVTIDVTPALAGEVDPSPDPNCSGGRYSAGTSLTLQASPDPAYEFDHWSGSITGITNPRTIVVDEDKTITAHFRAKNPTCRELVLNHTGNGGNPQAAPDRSPGCQAGFYVTGEAVALTALPAPGQRVGRWEGTDNDATHSPTNTATIPARDHTVVAHYERTPAVHWLFIPVVNDEPCFTGQEQEPNDSTATANGPVCLGQPLFGRLDNRSDYFRLELEGPWLLDVEMAYNAAQLPNLQLFDSASPPNLLDNDTRPPYRLRKHLGPGVYYLRVAIPLDEPNAMYTLLFR